jgi:hypothetical protein
LSANGFKVANSANKSKTKFWPNIWYEYHKTQNSMLSSNPLKKCKKSPKLLHTVIKVKKKIFCHFFTDNFFRMISLQFFQRIRNQHRILLFMIAILNFCKPLFSHFSTCYNLWRQSRSQETGQKTKKICY